MSNSAELAAIGVMANADAMHRHLTRAGRKLYGPSSKQPTGAASGWRVMRCVVAELSPAARAIMNAYMDEDRAGRLAVAAVLRAAVDQVIPKNGDMPLNMAHRLSWDARQQVRQQLLAIATELESAQ